MFEVKGHFIVAGADWVKREWGEEGLRRVVEALPPESRKLMERPVLPSGWYPYTLWADWAITVDRVLGKGDTALIREGGRQHARMQARGLYSLLFKVVSPKFLLKKTAQLWHLNFRPGSAEVEFSEREADVKFAGFEFDGRHFPVWHGTAGWIEEAMRLTGGKDPEVKIVKPLPGESWVVRFRVKWS